MTSLAINIGVQLSKMDDLEVIVDDFEGIAELGISKLPSGSDLLGRKKQPSFLASEYRHVSGPGMRLKGD